MRLVSPRSLLLASACLLVTASVASACPNSKAAATKSAACAAKATQTAAVAPVPNVIVPGLWAYLDPETGTLTGSVTDLVAPSDLVTPPTTLALPEVRLPDGSYMVDLQGQFMENVVMHVDPFGIRSFVCGRGVNVNTPVAAPKAQALVRMPSTLEPVPAPVEE